MICTFCGGENRAENRFCGMCGVRLERRQAERRATQGTIKCPSCGNENDPGYKFCGMCGTRVERRMQERRSADERAVAMANAQLPTPESKRKAAEPVMTATPTLPREPQIPPAPAVPPKATSLPQEPRVSSSSVYVNPEPSRSSGHVGGPSIFGLNTEPEPQNEGEYLLEDESSSRGGLRTLVLMVILAAILGLIFVQWRSSIKASPKAPLPSKPGASQTEPEGANNSGKQPPPFVAQNSNAGTSLENSAHRNPDELPPSPSSSQKSADQPQPFSEPAARDKGKGGDNEKEAAAATPGKDDKAAKDDKDEDQEQASDENAAATRQGGGKDKDTAAPMQKPSAALVRAQQYLQGRGVPQSCEQGLIYLKAATEQNDPRAAVQMGALYSSGFCVEQDRVKAYKWFASAHDLEPSNRWIDRNLNQLWAQMSPDERRKVQQ